ncbi:alpha-L-arabinofuranosidase C-terminal domain-containing protein [Chitinophaga rhizophila]|uniref:non-reducing end alpha-L-arabinofuranosidase n=1 Tax=Chitinophaga rhizophila TaxID=2866212 RepID=A0ABS7GIC9_9BACT|nr:alpha-L-arabinofuranosidase C-terminal domain-containing protein [Chitinophaga rhizophila]MBW8687446.1 carbohydrate binding domain-containing protein [Chitinophaga rhizophila]
MKRLRNIVATALLLMTGHLSFSQTLTLKMNGPQSEVQPTMWGIFFEDINFSADGGIYAELIKNRSFEFTVPMMGWKEVRKEGTGNVLIVNRETGHAANPRYAHLTISAGSGSYGLFNEGFRGIGYKKGMQYNFSFLARSTGGQTPARLVLVDEKGERIGETTIPAVTGKDWKKYVATVTADRTVTKGGVQLLFSGNGTLDIDMVSLFPQDTWKQRPGGLRNDLVQLLADLHPGFVRFPGGCIVEGRDLANRYQWKKTVGKVEDRTLIVNRWNTEFAHRAPGDYFQSYGLGFYEYFQLSEDLGAAPLPIINCGMACQFNTGEVAADEDVAVYIQDALDLIEFANGATSTKWGQLRADMGHPAPFNLQFLGVGNEQWDSQYIARYQRFEEVLKTKHPEIKLVSSVGPFSSGDRFDYLWSKLKPSKADLVDEHYYMPPEWFLKNAGRYDNYERKGPKIFAGEYAAHIKTPKGQKETDTAEGRNTWESALAEAAFMTGLERNADIVQMASYAPLLAHVDAWQWRPDLIWFDNLRSVGTPNYYVQKLFANSRGTHTVSVTANGKTLTGQDGIYASATIDKTSKKILLKVVNATDKAIDYKVALEGAATSAGPVTHQVLTAANKTDINTLDAPAVVAPVENKLKATKNNVPVSVGANSLNVITIPYK